MTAEPQKPDAEKRTVCSENATWIISDDDRTIIRYEGEVYAEVRHEADNRENAGLWEVCRKLKETRAELAALRSPAAGVTREQVLLSPERMEEMARELDGRHDYHWQCAVGNRETGMRIYRNYLEDLLDGVASPSPEPAAEGDETKAACPNDTNGDGDCGQRGCPYCGGGPNPYRDYHPPAPPAPAADGGGEAVDWPTQKTDKKAGIYWEREGRIYEVRKVTGEKTIVVVDGAHFYWPTNPEGAHLHGSWFMLRRLPPPACEDVEGLKEELAKARSELDFEQSQREELAEIVRETSAKRAAAERERDEAVAYWDAYKEVYKRLRAEAATVSMSKRPETLKAYREIIAGMEALEPSAPAEERGEEKPRTFMGRLDKFLLDGDAKEVIDAADQAAGRLMDQFSEADDPSDRYGDLHATVMLANVVRMIARRLALYDADLSPSSPAAAAGGGT